MTFPTILWTHHWHPCVHRLPDEDGHLRLYLTLVNETSAGAELMVEYCLDHCSFHEYPLGSREPGLSMRLFFSQRLKHCCKERGRQIGNLDIEQQLFYCAGFASDSNMPSITWFTQCGISVCAFQTRNEDRATHMYLMLASECPAKEVHPDIPF